LKIRKEENNEKDSSILFNNIVCDLRIYPNPASGTITIEYHQFTGMEKMILSDITGKPLLDNKLSEITSNIEI